MYLLGEWDGRGARELAADRKAQRIAWLAENPPDVISFGADTMRLPPRAIPPATGKPGEWAGVGVSPGQAQGTARVILHPREGERLRPGEVLVAPSTDPDRPPGTLTYTTRTGRTYPALPHAPLPPGTPAGPVPTSSRAPVGDEPPPPF